MGQRMVHASRYQSPLFNSHFSCLTQSRLASRSGTCLYDGRAWQDALNQNTLRPSPRQCEIAIGFHRSYHRRFLQTCVPSENSNHRRSPITSASVRSGQLDLLLSCNAYRSPKSEFRRQLAHNTACNAVYGPLSIANMPNCVLHTRSTL
jgi:hypothetical protein